MKILFIVRHFSYLRLFESAIEALAARGHQLVLAADREESMGGRQMVERIAARYPNVSVTAAPGRHAGAWAELARRIRMGLDFLRFLEPQYQATPHLRRRAEERAPAAIVGLARSRLLRPFGGPRALAALLRMLERGIPPAPALEAFLREHAPDVLLITPLVDIGSPQLDHLAAARHVGLRTVLPVGSWDHLSSKALLRDVPERVIVWNEMQRAEAIGMHRVPADRVVVTGAQCYDQWFDRTPSRSREAFCARVGLRADRPFVLYVCSSLFRGTADEPGFVEQWVRALRTSDDPRLRDIGILIRPHPARLDEWRGRDWSDYTNLTVWGAHPVDQESKDDYFDSMYYSAAVVGVNTSAFLEAAAVGKPVHTILLPELSQNNQEGTLHFHYLLTVNGGLLRVARSFEEHVPLLAESLAGEGGGDPKAERFVEGFVRPFGRGEAATPRFVDAVESAASLPAPPAPSALARLPGYVLLFPAAVAVSLYLRAQPWRARMRRRARKAYERALTQLIRRLRQIAIDYLGHKASSEPGKADPSNLTAKAGQRRDAAKSLAGTRLPDAVETRALVTTLGRSGAPIILGPWLSEAGFELLYWIPFLRWARAYGHFDPARIVAISRGGAASWYADVTDQYEDVFSFFTPDEFREANERRIREQGGRLKHVEVSSFDREIVAKVTAKRGLRDAQLLHPSLMYQLYEHYWHQRVPMTLVEAFSVFARLQEAPPSGIRAELPARYVAAKFYGNTAFPDTPENRAFVARFLADLSQQVDVVLLNTSDRFDDHDDFQAAARGRIHVIADRMRPEDNLAVQTEVIRGAEAFVGTYGGFSYLAPLSGTHTIAFYSHPSGFRFDHLEVAKRVFAGLGGATFVEMDVRAADAMRLGFGGGVRPMVGSL